MKVHEIDATGTESNEDMGIPSNFEVRSNGVSLRGGAVVPGKSRVD